MRRRLKLGLITLGGDDDAVIVNGPIRHCRRTSGAQDVAPALLDQAIGCANEAMHAHAHVLAGSPVGFDSIRSEQDGGDLAMGGACVGAVEGLERLRPAPRAAIWRIRMAAWCWLEGTGGVRRSKRSGLALIAPDGA